MRKNQKLYIPIEKEHKQKLEKKAEETGLTLAAFCRLVLLNSLRGKVY